MKTEKYITLNKKVSKKLKNFFRNINKFFLGLQQFKTKNSYNF